MIMQNQRTNYCAIITPKITIMFFYKTIWAALASSSSTANYHGGRYVQTDRQKKTIANVIHILILQVAVSNNRNQPTNCMAAEWNEKKLDTDAHWIEIDYINTFHFTVESIMKNRKDRNLHINDYTAFSSVQHHFKSHCHQSSPKMVKSWLYMFQLRPPSSCWWSCDFWGFIGCCASEKW